MRSMTTRLVCVYDNDSSFSWLRHAPQLPETTSHFAVTQAVATKKRAQDHTKRTVVNLIYTYIEYSIFVLVLRARPHEATVFTDV